MKDASAGVLRRRHLSFCLRLGLLSEKRATCRPLTSSICLQVRLLTLRHLSALNKLLTHLPNAAGFFKDTRAPPTSPSPCSHPSRTSAHAEYRLWIAIGSKEQMSQVLRPTPLLLQLLLGSRLYVKQHTCWICCLMMSFSVFAKACPLPLCSCLHPLDVCLLACL